MWQSWIILIDCGPAARGAIAEGISVFAKTVQFHPGTLQREAVVLADPPPDLVRSGQRVLYRVQPERLAELHTALGTFLHVDSRRIIDHVGTLDPGSAARQLPNLRAAT